MAFDGVELETGLDPKAAFLWLHGLGADGNDFAPLVPELVEAGWPPLRFVFPHAPIRPIGINQGMRMRGWYDIASLDLRQGEDAAGISESVETLEGLLQREAERGLPAERVFLAGFSQGGAIALSTAIRQRKPVAGVIALSTYLPGVAAAAPDAVAQDIFMAHGSLDPIVPQTLGQHSAQRLRAAGHRLSWHSYPMGHQVCAEEIADLRRWLAARLPR